MDGLYNGRERAKKTYCSIHVDRKMVTMIHCDSVYVMICVSLEKDVQPQSADIAG